MTNDFDKMFLDSLKRELNTQDCHGQMQPCYWIVMEHRHVPARSCDADGYTILDDGTAYDVHEFIGKIRDEVYPRFTDSQKKEWNTIIDEDYLCREDDVVDFLNGTEFYSDLQVVPYTEKDVENYDGGIFLTEKDCVDWIKRNRHNLVEPRPYAKTMHDNPVMSRLIDIVRKTDWL